MAKLKKTSEEFIDELIERLRVLEYEQRMSFALDILYNTTLWAGETHVDMMGLLECTKADIINTVIFPPDDDDDGDEWKKLINKN